MRRRRLRKPTSYHDSTAPYGNHDDSAPPLNLAGAHAPENGSQSRKRTHRRSDAASCDGRPSRGARAGRAPDEAAEPAEAAEAHYEEPDYEEGTVQFDAVRDEPLRDDDDPLLHD